MTKKQNNKAGTEPAKTTVPAMVTKVSDIRHTLGGINVTMDRHMTEAEKLFEKIGVGRENAVKVNGRDAYNRTTREFKRLVSEARKQGDIIINTGDGSGYYRPDWNNPEDAAAALATIRSMSSRASEIDKVVIAMTETYEREYGQYQPW